MTPRSITVIQQQIIDAKNADTNLSELTSQSQVANWLSWSYIQAVAINLFENVIALFQSEIEAQVATAAPGTPSWIRDRVLEFQWSDTVPQVIQYLDDNSLGYPVIDTSLRIITQCAVITTINNVVQIKVTNAGTPLTGDQLTALTSYLDFLNFAGIQFVVISADPDLFMCGVTVTYNGQYSGVISDTVQAAIVSYLANIPFNGKVTLSLLEDAIQAVPGVIDVLFNNVEIRASFVLAADATVLVDDNDVLLQTYPTYAGNAIIDTDSGRTLDDTVVLIPN